jgi:hypothetical protein
MSSNTTGTNNTNRTSSTSSICGTSSVGGLGNTGSIRNSSSAVGTSSISNTSCTSNINSIDSISGMSRTSSISSSAGQLSMEGHVRELRSRRLPPETAPGPPRYFPNTNINTNTDQTVADVSGKTHTYMEQMLMCNEYLYVGPLFRVSVTKSLGAWI